MGDDEAMACFVASAGLGVAPVLVAGVEVGVMDGGVGVAPVLGSAVAAGEGTAVVLWAALETLGDGLVVPDGDSANAGDKLEAARTAEAATAHRRPEIFRMLDPPRDGVRSWHPETRMPFHTIRAVNVR